jgi:uncharacterized membrane protein YdbT with pleckstrin-like domain
MEPMKPAGYVMRNLQPDEKILYHARLHWIIYKKAIVCWLLAASTFALALALVLTENLYAALPASAVGALALFVSLPYAINAWWNQFTTEIVVTNRRIIFVRGFIQRHTTEMALLRVESVLVDQSIFGRLLGFGSVHCRGTGEGMEHLHRVANPVALRNSIITH